MASSVMEEYRSAGRNAFRIIPYFEKRAVLHIQHRDAPKVESVGSFALL